VSRIAKCGWVCPTCSVLEPFTLGASVGVNRPTYCAIELTLVTRLGSRIGALFATGHPDVSANV
jgi:hypothetical protein